MDKDNDMLIEKSWLEFRETGLVWLINSLLHLFGWAITYNFEKDPETGELTLISVVPSRTKFRGFSQETNDANYKRITEYMINNSEELMNDIIKGDNQNG